MPDSEMIRSGDRIRFPLGKKPGVVEVTIIQDKMTVGEFKRFTQEPVEVERYAVKNSSHK